MASSNLFGKLNLHLLNILGNYPRVIYVFVVWYILLSLCFHMTRGIKVGSTTKFA